MKSLAHLHNETGWFLPGPGTQHGWLSHASSQYLLSSVRIISVCTATSLLVLQDLQQLCLCRYRRCARLCYLLLWCLHLLSAFRYVKGHLLCAGVLLTYICSYHIVNNHSERLAVLGNQLDYLGIVILMWGAGVPSIYYGFYCDHSLQKFYWTFVSSFASSSMPIFF